MEMDDSLTDFLTVTHDEDEYIPETELELSLKKATQCFPDIKIPCVGEKDDYGFPEYKDELIYQVVDQPVVATLIRHAWNGNNYYGLVVHLLIKWIDVSEEQFKKYELPDREVTKYFCIDEEYGKPFFIKNIICDNYNEEGTVTELLEALADE